MADHPPENRDDYPEGVTVDDTRVENQCSRCAHRKKGTPGCTAFEVIPAAILLGHADHRFPYPGDHGIRFTPRQDA